MPVCSDCDEEFSSSHGLKVHYGMVHEKKMRECKGEDCDELVSVAYDRRWCDSCVPDFSGENNQNYQGGKDVVECVECGSEFECYTSVKPGKYCSDCVQDDDVYWGPKGAGSSSNYGAEFRQAKVQVLKRDQHRCQNCLVTSSDLGQEPDVHHIRPARLFDGSEAHQLSNLVALCRSCHRRADEGELPEFYDPAGV